MKFIEILLKFITHDKDGVLGCFMQDEIEVVENKERNIITANQNNP